MVRKEKICNHYSLQGRHLVFISGNGAEILCKKCCKQKYGSTDNWICKQLGIDKAKLLQLRWWMKGWDRKDILYKMLAEKGAYVCDVEQKLKELDLKSKVEI